MPLKPSPTPGQHGEEGRSWVTAGPWDSVLCRSAAGGPALEPGELWWNGLWLSPSAVLPQSIAYLSELLDVEGGGNLSLGPPGSIWRPGLQPQLCHVRAVPWGSSSSAPGRSLRLCAMGVRCPSEGQGKGSFGRIGRGVHGWAEPWAVCLTGSGLGACCSSGEWG